MTEETLFEQALARPAAERAAFLDKACAGQPELRAAVAALLAAHEAPESLFDKPPQQLAQTVDSDLGGPGPDAMGESEGEPRPTGEYRPGVAPGIVIAGHYTNAGASSINAHEQINRKHLEIRGCWGSEPAHFLRALALLERHASSVPWREIGARTYGLAQLNDALADAEAMRIPKALVDPRVMHVAQ